MRIVSVSLSRLGVLFLRVCALTALALVVLILMATAGGAADATSPVVQGTPVLTVDAALVAMIASLIIPLLNVLLTKLTASGVLKSIVAVVLAAVTTFAAAIAGVSGVVSVRDVIVVFLLTLVGAAGQRFTWMSPLERYLALKFPNTGLGGAKIVPTSELYTDHHA